MTNAPKFKTFLSRPPEHTFVALPVCTFKKRGTNASQMVLFLFPYNIFLKDYLIIAGIVVGAPLLLPWDFGRRKGEE